MYTYHSIYCYYLKFKKIDIFSKILLNDVKFEFSWLIYLSPKILLSYNCLLNSYLTNKVKMIKLNIILLLVYI